MCREALGIPMDGTKRKCLPNMVIRKSGSNVCVPGEELVWSIPLWVEKATSKKKRAGKKIRKRKKEWRGKKELNQRRGPMSLWSGVDQVHTRMFHKHMWAIESIQKSDCITYSPILQQYICTAEHRMWMTRPLSFPSRSQFIRSQQCLPLPIYHSLSHSLHRSLSLACAICFPHSRALSSLWSTVHRPPPPPYKAYTDGATTCKQTSTRNLANNQCIYWVR